MFNKTIRNLKYDLLIITQYVSKSLQKKILFCFIPLVQAKSNDYTDLAFVTDGSKYDKIYPKLLHQDYSRDSI